MVNKRDTDITVSLRITVTILTIDSIEPLKTCGLKSSFRYGMELN